MRRFARDRRVLFWEEARFANSDEATLDVRTCPESGVVVVAPLLPKGRNEADREATLQTLLGIFLAGQQGPFVRWYCTPEMLPFSRQIESAGTVYDRLDGPVDPGFAPARLHALERELIEAADFVFTDGEIDAMDRPDLPEAFAARSAIPAAPPPR